jgi:hypothetical protein
LTSWIREPVHWPVMQVVRPGTAVTFVLPFATCQRSEVHHGKGHILGWRRCCLAEQERRLLRLPLVLLGRKRDFGYLPKHEYPNLPIYYCILSASSSCLTRIKYSRDGFRVRIHIQLEHLGAIVHKSLNAFIKVGNFVQAHLKHHAAQGFTSISPFLL